MAELNIKLPAPHPGQQAVRTQMRRFNWLSAGRRWRKTTLFMAIAVEDVLAGYTDLWGAPTYDQVMIGWEEMRRAVGGVFQFNKTEKTAKGPTGGKLLFRSLDDPENARGHTVTGRAFFDETADIPERAWNEIIRPMLMDSGAGLMAGGTPKGRNWFWREWVAAHDRADSAAWQVPTLGAEIIDGKLYRKPHPYENPDIRFDELRQMFDTMPERSFRQEILAEFLENAGGVFHSFSACVGGRLVSAPPHPQTRYCMGVDLAKYNDYTVCVVMDMQQRAVVAFERYNLAEWPLQKARISALAAKWNNAAVWMDTTGVGDPIFDDLARAGLRITGYTLTAISKRELIEKLILLMEQQHITFPDIPELLQELAAYEYERLPAGGLRMTAPQGLHDDCVIALALACWPLAVSGTQTALPQESIELLRTQYTDLHSRSLLKKTF